MDCTKEKSICGEFEVTSYPTLLYLNKAKLVAKYDGSRQLHALKTFVDQQIAKKTDIDVDEESGRIHTATDEDEVCDRL